MYPVDPKLAAVHESILASKRLEKLAQVYADDNEVLEKIAAAKVRVDDEIFGVAKEAGALDWARKAVSWAGPKGSIGRGLATGGAVSAGLSIPAYLAGSSLLEKGRKETEETARSIRNRVLEGALGVGALGAGMYGLHKLMGGSQGGKAPGGNGLLGMLPKLGSDEKARVEETLEKLATVGTIESMLDMLPDTIDEETRKLASELRVLNRSYGVHLLHGLYPDDA